MEPPTVNLTDYRRWLLFLFATERSLVGDTSDMIGIAIDCLYSSTTSLFYAIGVLRAIKWFFFILRFIGWYLHILSTSWFLYLRYIHLDIILYSATGAWILLKCLVTFVLFYFGERSAIATCYSKLRNEATGALFLLDIYSHAFCWCTLSTFWYSRNYNKFNYFDLP